MKGITTQCAGQTARDRSSLAAQEAYSQPARSVGATAASKGQRECGAQGTSTTGMMPPPAIFSRSASSVPGVLDALTSPHSAAQRSARAAFRRRLSSPPPAAPQRQVPTQPLPLVPAALAPLQGSTGAADPVAPHREDMKLAVEGDRARTNIPLADDLPIEQIHPHPMVFTAEQIAEQKRFHSLLSKAIKGLVAEYFEPAGEPLRSTLNLDAKIERVLRWANEQGIEYRIGSFRPDTLFPEGGTFEICEINSRFTTNCFITGYVGNELVGSVDYLAAEGVGKVDSIADIPAAFSRRFPDTDRPINLLQGRHHIDDVVNFPKMMEACGREVVRVKPNELQAVDGKLCGTDGRRLDYVVMDLYQDEIEALSESVLTALMSTEACLNDLRTVFIVHDKRLLAFLSDPETLSRHLGDPEDARFLREHVCETHVMDKLPPVHPDFATHKDQWVVKPYRDGAGKGVVIGPCTTEQRWQQAVEEAMVQGYVAQRYAAPQPYRVADLGDGRAPGKIVTVFGSGVMPLLDDTFCGPGLTRFNVTDVVNLTGKGFAMFPAVPLWQKDAE